MQALNLACLQLFQVFSHQSSHKCPCIYPPYIYNSSHTHLLLRFQ